MTKQECFDQAMFINKQSASLFWRVQQRAGAIAQSGRTTEQIDARNAADLAAYRSQRAEIASLMQQYAA